MTARPGGLMARIWEEGVLTVKTEEREALEESHRIAGGRTQA